MMTSEGPSTSPTLLDALRAQETRQDAWRTFLERYQPLLHRWCRGWHLQHADAEEVTGRVLAKLAESLRSFRYNPGHRFRGWLKTVVDNAVRNFLREVASRPGTRGSGHASVQRRLEHIKAPNAVDALVEELNEHLECDWHVATLAAERVRARVAEHTWRAYWLTVVAGQTAREAADQLGMSLAAVYVAKGRVGKLLRTEGDRVAKEVTDEPLP